MVRYPNHRPRVSTFCHCWASQYCGAIRGGSALPRSKAKQQNQGCAILLIIVAIIIGLIVNACHHSSSNSSSGLYSSGGSTGLGGSGLGGSGTGNSGVGSSGTASTSQTSTHHHHHHHRHHHDYEPPAPATSSSAAGSGASCTADAVYNSQYHNYDVYVHSNQPHQTAYATASNGEKWHYGTNSSGYADIFLDADPGDSITVTVGAATCYTTAG